MTTCVRCNQEFEGRGYFLKVPSDRYCPVCYGAVAEPHYSVSFHALFLVSQYRRISQWKWFPHYDSVKIYRFNDEKPKRPWAWAVVANGDYHDIKEGHVRSAVADYGTIPELITLEDLEQEAREYCDKNRKHVLSSELLKKYAIEFGFVTEE